MVNQTAVTFFGVQVPDSLTGSLTELGHDVMTLADLQAKLARADLDETVTEAKVPAIGLVVGLVVLLVSLPILMVGLAELLVSYDALPRFGSYLAVGGGFAVLAALTSWLCLRSLSKCGRSFGRSKEEFSRNVSWIARVISEGGSLRLRQPGYRPFGRY